MDVAPNSHTQLYVITVLLYKNYAAKLMNALHKKQLPHILVWIGRTMLWYQKTPKSQRFNSINVYFLPFTMCTASPGNSPGEALSSCFASISTCTFKMADYLTREECVEVPSTDN